MPPVTLRLDNYDSRTPIFFPLLSPFSVFIPLFLQPDKAIATSPKTFLAAMQSSVQPKQLRGVTRRLQMYFRMHAPPCPPASRDMWQGNGAQIAWFKQVLGGVCACVGRRRFAELARETAQWWLSSCREVPISCNRHRSSSPTKESKG